MRRGKVLITREERGNDNNYSDCESRRKSGHALNKLKGKYNRDFNNKQVVKIIFHANLFAFGWKVLDIK